MNKVVLLIALIVVIASIGTAAAEEIFLTCTATDAVAKVKSPVTYTYNLEISDHRVISDGKQLTDDVTISNAYIVYKTMIKEIYLIVDHKIDRASGTYTEIWTNLKTLETAVRWSGSCTKAVRPSQKF